MQVRSSSLTRKMPSVAFFLFNIHANLTLERSSYAPSFVFPSIQNAFHGILFASNLVFVLTWKEACFVSRLLLYHIIRSVFSVSPKVSMSSAAFSCFFLFLCILCSSSIYDRQAPWFLLFHYTGKNQSPHRFHSF